jgi:hypothetical protein
VGIKIARYSIIGSFPCNKELLHPIARVSTNNYNYNYNNKQRQKQVLITISLDIFPERRSQHSSIKFIYFYARTTSPLVIFYDAIYKKILSNKQQTSAMTENQNLESYHLYIMTICFSLTFCPMTRIDTAQDTCFSYFF